MIFTEYSSKTLAAAVEKLGLDDRLHTILVPVDFSDCSDNAIRFAVAIALRTGGRIKLFHSVQLPLQMIENVAYPLDQLEREAATKLGSIADEIVHWLESERLRKIEVQHRVCIGFPGDEIAKEAEHQGTDLIVMGTHGVGALEGLLLGSNASSVMQRVQCPVLVVPEDAEFEGFKRIAYASDMHEINRAAIHILIRFAGHFDSQVHVLHVMGKNDQLSTAQANAFREEFVAVAKYDHLSFHIVDAEEDTLVHTVDEYMDANDIEVLAMLTHRRSFLDKLLHRSVTKRFAMHAHTPVLAFH